MNKPYSESCEQNKAHILSVIKPLIASHAHVLEIGSGTGQHAIYFAENMPEVTWHTSDCLPYIAGIKMWLSESKLNNVVEPVELNVSTSQWPDFDADAVFTANSIHIMSHDDMLKLIEGVATLLKSQGDLIIYGPFNYSGQYTSESNMWFDQSLKSRDENSGIKHFEDILSAAKKNGLSLVKDYEMPANNRILHFSKI